MTAWPSMEGFHANAANDRFPGHGAGGAAGPGARDSRQHQRDRPGQERCRSRRDGEITNTDTSQTQQLVTNARGYFEALLLNPGTYAVASS